MAKFEYNRLFKKILSVTSMVCISITAITINTVYASDSDSLPVASKVCTGDTCDLVSHDQVVKKVKAMINAKIQKKPKVDVDNKVVNTEVVKSSKVESKPVSIVDVSDVDDMQHDYNSSGLAKNAKHISFSQNQTVTVNLSIDDANLLQVKGDKIKGVSCLQGYCSIQPIRSSGSVLLTLGQLGRSADSGFTSYVTTTSGRQFSILILPQSSSGQTIEFQPQSGGSISNTKLPKNADYQSTLSQIIADMINYGQTGQAPEGYGVQFIKDSTAINPKGDLLVFPVGVFSGTSYNGLIYKVKNNTHSSVNLTAKQFYQKGVLAAALTSEQVKPQGVTYLYEVTIK